MGPDRARTIQIHLAVLPARARVRGRRGVRIRARVMLPNPITRRIVLCGWLINVFSQIARRSMIQRKRAGTNRRLSVPAGTREKNVIASLASLGMTPNKNLVPISPKVRVMPERPVGTSTLSELGR